MKRTILCFHMTLHHVISELGRNCRNSHVSPLQALEVRALCTRQAYRKPKFGKCSHTRQVSHTLVAPSLDTLIESLGQQHTSFCLRHLLGYLPIFTHDSSSCIIPVDVRRLGDPSPRLFTKFGVSRRFSVGYIAHCS